MDAESLTRREKLDGVRRVATRRPRLTLAVAGLSLVTAVFGGVGLGFILPIVELAQSGGPSSDTGGLLGVFVTVYATFGLPLTMETAIAGVTLVMTVRFGVSFLVAWLRTKLQHEYIRDVRVQAFEQTLAASTAYFDRRSSDEILNAIITQSDYAGGFIKNAIRFLEKALVSLVFFCIALLLVPTLTLVTVIGFGVVTLLTRALFEGSEGIGSRVAAANERVQTVTQTGIQGIREVKLFRLESELAAQFRGAVTTLTESSIRLNRNEAGVGKAFRLASSVTVFLLLYLGIVVFSVPLSRLSVFLFAMFRLAPQLSSMNDIFYRAEGDLPHVVRTEAFLESVADSAESDGHGLELDPPMTTIEYDEVTFAYDEEPVLDDISFSFERGEFVALVGGSGAGKSTVAALLGRLYTPDGGAIRADGTDIERFDVGDWRGRLSMVRQNPEIFSETLRYNLTVGNRDATDEELRRVCEIAAVTEFLDDLPEGYDTDLGDDGVRLSGGQRQRVAIARALLKDADVLVLDEATSDLDTHLEQRVHRAIERMERDYAVVAIAHRLSTVRDADRIYAFEDGRIVESGTHEELLEADGLYAALHGTQVQQP